jgi:hypothetical protein
MIAHRLGLLAVFLVGSASAAGPVSPAERELMDSISANTLRGHLSFLASDLLEGRDTPSRGLDLAAEYIASQFRRFGVEPGGDNGTYFQNAPYLKVSQPMQDFRLRLQTPDGKSWESTGAKVMAVTNEAVDATDLEVLKVTVKDQNSPLPSAEQVRGKAVLLYVGQGSAAAIARNRALQTMKPALLVTYGVLPPAPFRLRPASAPTTSTAPYIVTSDADFSKFVDTLPEGLTPAKLTAKVSAPVQESIQLRNVIGKLAGSDPTLRNEAILLTAHYDHVGVATRGDGDRIHNGANDDASGVSTVLALAESIAGRELRPKRTLIFMTYFGEEKGLLGSRYYAAHPVFPLRQTVANLNFEHMGRTDDSEGKREGQITATGFDYTTLGEALTAAGAATGVGTWSHPRNSDDFFGRSDNQALADAGVPAITVSVAWIFPDYHRPGDHWEKIDLPNMEKVVRTVAVGVTRVANGEVAPQWVDSHPKVKRYVEAFRKLHAAD